MCHHKMKIYKAQPETGHITLKIYLTFPMLSFEFFLKSYFSFMYCFCCFTLNFVNHLSKLCGPSSAAPPHGDTLHSHFILWQSDHCSNRLDANRIPVYALKMEAIKLMPRALFIPSSLLLLI